MTTVITDDINTDPALDGFLSTMEYPATRYDLVREAARDGLGGEDLAALAALPDESYEGGWYVRRQLARNGRSAAAQRELVGA